MNAPPSRLPRRTHPLHGILHVDGQPTIIFDTVCTKDRRAWLACEEVHRVLRGVWTEATEWLMGRYVMMPDHIHFFAGYAGGIIEYENWVKYWKSQFTKRFKQLTAVGRRIIGKHGCELRRPMWRNGFTFRTTPCDTAL